MRPAVCSARRSATPSTPLSAAAHPLADRLQRREIGPVDLRRGVGAHARDQLVGAHLDRLRDGGGHLRDLALDDLGDLLAELRLGQAAAPFRPRLEDDVDVALLDAHRIGGDLGSAGARDDVLHLRQAGEGAFHPQVRGDGLRERDSGKPPRFEQQVPLVELGHELGA